MYCQHSLQLLSRAYAAGDNQDELDSALESMTVNKQVLADDVARSVNVLGHIDGDVMFIAYLWRSDYVDYTTVRVAFELYASKTVWTMDVFTPEGREAMSEQHVRDIVDAMEEPVHELIVLKSLTNLVVLLDQKAVHMGLLAYVNTIALENALTELAIIASAD